MGRLWDCQVAVGSIFSKSLPGSIEINEKLPPKHAPDTAIDPPPKHEPHTLPTYADAGGGVGLGGSGAVARFPSILQYDYA